MKKADNLSKRPAKMDLMLFSEEEEGSVNPQQPAQPAQQQPAQQQPAQPAQQQPAQQQPAQPASDDPLLDFFKSREETQTELIGEKSGGAEEKSITPLPIQQPSEEQKILGKFNDYKDLEKSYLESEKNMHQTNQQLSQNQQQMWLMQNYIKMLENETNLQSVPQTAQTVIKTTPEQVEEQNQKWLDKFYENPTEAIKEIINPTLQTVLEPFQKSEQQRKEAEKWEGQVREVASIHPDFNELLPEIQQIVQEQGNYLARMPNAIHLAYDLAKMRKTSGTAVALNQQPMQQQPMQQQPMQQQPIQQQPIQQQQPTQPVQQPNLETLLQNPETRQQLLQNPTIQQEILKSYIEQVRQGKPPIVMGGEPGGQPPFSPPEQIRSVKEAGKRFTEYLRQKTGR